jgi:hypothetical protein
MIAEIRQDFFREEVTTEPVTDVSVTTLGASGNIRLNFTGSDKEGAIYGCIFVDFARRIGLREAVNGFLRSATSGAITFGGYMDWFRSNRPQHLNDLQQTQQTWGCINSLA